MKISNTAFEIGWYNSKAGDKAKIKKKIMAEIRIYDDFIFYDRLHGDVPMSTEDCKKIELIFNNHGVTEIWGKV